MSDRLLGGNFAKAALNWKITAGRLDPVKGPALVHTTLASSVVTMFRDRFEGADNWLVWPRVVDVVRSPTVQDYLGRLYFTGDGEPRMTTFADAISGPGPYPGAFYVLGVTPPGTAPALAVVGGVTPTESRAYVYTFKTRYAEESAPSLPVSVTGNANGSWDLSSMETAPPNSGTVSAAVTIATGVVEVTMNTVRGLLAYEQVAFAGVAGMTALNGTFALLSVDLATNKVTVALDTAQVYTAGGTWGRVAPHNTTGMTKVIYRSVGGNENFFRVAEIPVADTTYSDTVLGSALGEELPTLTSYTPPKNLHSLVALANGSLAGIAGNEICFSEQYRPHSWPIANRYAFAGQGVAAYATGNSVLVLTDTNPVVATATIPEAASVASLPTYAPCVAKTGVVDAGGACLYPSHDGLYLASPGDVKNVTDGVYRYDEWQAIHPETFVAAFFDQRYYAMHDAVAGATAKIMVLDLAEPDSIVEIDERVGAMYTNPWDGRLYIGKANKIYVWDEDDSNRYLGFWYSRVYQLGTPLNFTCAQVHAQYSDIVPLDTGVQDANAALMADADDVNGALGSAPINTYAINGSAITPVTQATRRWVQFSILRDGEIVFTKELSTSDAFRLPGGYRSELYSFQITASIPVHSASIAQSMQELVQASQ